MTRPRPRDLRHALLISALFASTALRATERPVSFDRDIQPILAENCYHCHGPDAEERKARFRLDQRDAAFAGGKSDLPAIVPGMPDESEIILRVFAEDEEDIMPTPESNRSLTAEQKELLRRWIAEGAKWETHWAFASPTRPDIPDTNDRGAHPIDPFVRARLAAENLAPAPPASREELIRRVSLDLNGLPPAPAEVAAFVADRSPDAYEKLVDRLLASPRYGERWAWDWLDIARYSDTNGFQRDFERDMWPWRDWVVNALNANQPYDQFTIEQLAGDLLPDATTEQKLASGFNRNNMFNGEGGRIPEETRVENVFDRVETTATTWMGLTFACTRCHDHKFDPLKQTDYFALYDIFNQTSETGVPNGFGTTSGKIPPVLDLSPEDIRVSLEQSQAKLAAIAKEIHERELTKFPRPYGLSVSESPAAQELPGKLFEKYIKVEPGERPLGQVNAAYRHFTKVDPDPEYAATLERHIAILRENEELISKTTQVMIMDQLAEPRDTFVLNKGNYASVSKIRVTGNVPEIFRHADSAAQPERMNRLDFARWLVSPGNPLAARTFVNRAWQAYFGTGFVKTAEDFGVQSERPSHPELIDWLATEFVESGWNMKALHRLIVTSATYRQSSRVTPELYERDPENRLLARGPRHRLPSWMIRDQALAIAGLLSNKQGGPAVKPYQPAGLWEEASFGKITYEQDHGESLYRRSLYVYWRRIVGPTTFFNTGSRQVCTVKVDTTNTPLHALVTLNDPVFVEAARVMAQRVFQEADTDRDRIERALLLAAARVPNANERAILAGRLETLRRQFAADPSEASRLVAVGEYPRPNDIDPSEHAAWTSLCLLILNLDETLSLQ